MAALERATAYGLRAATWLAGAMALVSATPAAAAGMGYLSDLADLAAPAAARGLELVWQGFDQQPSIMLAGAVASAVPLVGAAAALARSLGRLARRRAALREQGSAAPRTAEHNPNLAWLQVEHRGTPPLRLGELVRIGCSADCDLALGDSGVADIHALIQRTPDSEFVIFDVSDADEGGLTVNGKLSSRRRLRDGDRIGIGTAHVVFHAKSSSQTNGHPAAA